MLLRLHSEEQKPLEDFFRAKGIKTKNEMADDVSTILLSLQIQANNALYSLGPFWQLLSKTKISRPVMMELQQTAVVPTKTTRVLMKTFRQIRNRKLVRSSTLIFKAAAPIAMLRWRMRRATPRNQQCQKGRRRSRRCRKNDGRQPQANTGWQVLLFPDGLRLIEDPETQ